MRKITIGLGLVLSVLWAGALSAQNNNNQGTVPPAPVPKTGQVTCYDAGGNVINCAGTGQDGELQKGVELPTPRFTDKGNGTVKDNLTGLTWLKNANCPNGAKT